MKLLYQCAMHRLRICLKSLIIMKLVFVLLITGFLQQGFSANAQQVTIAVKNVSLQYVLKEIRKQTGYDFLFGGVSLKNANPVSMNVRNGTLEEALKASFKNQPFSYKISKNAIVISRKLTPVPSREVLRVQQQVTGSVTDESGHPLMGVTVAIKGSNEGTTTNREGAFSLNVEDGNVLVFRYLGFVTQEVTYSGQPSIAVRLTGSEVSMDEIVVVGYGTQKRVSMTSAVSEIKGEEMQRRPVSNLQQALQGQVSGLTILDQGGAPGRSDATIRVRGVTTIGDNNPLVIVDGIEQPMADLNPNDIESISLLKDASSTAIYGSRAANGVLLITTKRAKAGEVSVLYDGFYAIQSAINKPEHMGLEEYMRYQNTAYTNVGSNPRFTEDQIQEYVNATDRYRFPLPNTWFDRMLLNAPQINNSVAVSGGNETFKGRLSVRHQDQKGIIKNLGSEIYDIRTNADFKILSNIKLQTDVNYRYTTNSAPASQFNVFNIMLHASQWTVPQYPDGTYGLSPQGRSPLVENELGGFSHQAEDYIVGNMKGEWEIIKNLRFTTQFGARVNLFADKNYLNTYEIRDYYNPEIVRKSVMLNNLTETRNIIREYTLNALLNYSATFTDDHSLDVLVGYSQISNDVNNLSAFRQGFYNNDIQSIGQGADDATKDNDGGELNWGLRSFFGRVNYAFRDKYLFEANSRYDGSSRFTGDKRYSFFPSFSAGWRLSEEPFWSGIKDQVSEFKLRGSWGKTGNQAVDLYSYFSTLDLLGYSFNGLPAQAYAQLQMANENITWETTTQTDVGLDAQLLNGQITLGVDYYHKKTDGILLVLPVPGTLGLLPAPQNAGRVDNKGWEFTGSYRNTFGRLGFTGSANFNINNNKVISLAGTGPYITGSNVDPMMFTGEGYPINSFWGYKTDGFFQSVEEVESYPTIANGVAPGDVKYLDLNGDQVINSDDMRYLAPSFPKYTFGASLNFTCKNFGLNLLWQGAANVSTRLSGALAEMGNQEGFTHKIYTDNYWTPERPDAEFPRPTKFSLLNIHSADRMLTDGTYLRLKNIQLLYDIPSTVLEKTFIKNIGVYVSGTNLLTFSKLNRWNLDPETPPGRANYYPQTALYSLGVKVQL